MNKVECALECGHSVRLTIGSPVATLGESTYCRFDGWRNIVTIYHREWRVVCADCQYGRWCGQSEKEAQRDARRHNYLRGGHTTLVAYDAITRSGGTSRKVLLDTLLTPVVKPCNDVPITPDEPAPF